MVEDSPTTSQLRDKIDKGLAGSKIDVLDPAAAPLGTDDEAAGTPSSGEAIKAAIRDEVKSSPSSSKNGKIDAGVTVYLGIMVVIVAAACVMAVALL